MGARQQRRCAERVKLGGLLGLLLCGAPAAQEAGGPADSWTAEIDRRLTGLTFLLACADPACEGCDRRCRECEGRWADAASQAAVAATPGGSASSVPGALGLLSVSATVAAGE